MSVNYGGIAGGVSQPGALAVIDVKAPPYGAFGDAKQAGDGAMTAGSNLLTCATSTPFISPAADIGKVCYVYGAQDRIVADAVTNGTTTITSATIRFSARDIGKTVTGTGIPANTTIASLNSTTSAVLNNATGTNNPGTLNINGGGVLQSSIIGWTDSGDVLLNDNAVRTISNAGVQFGHDDTAAIQAAITAGLNNMLTTPATSPVTVYFPSGGYLTKPLNVWIAGTQFTTGTLMLRGAGEENSILMASAGAISASGTGSGGGNILAAIPGTGLTAPPRILGIDLYWDGEYNGLLDSTGNPTVGGIVNYNQNATIINLGYPYQGSGGNNWSALFTGTSVGTPTATTVTIPTGIISNGGVLLPNIVGALISIDSQLASTTVAIGYGLIQSVAVGSPNDVITLAAPNGQGWTNTFTGSTYTPATSATTVKVNRQNFRGFLHKFERCHFYRPAGFVTFPTPMHFHSCTFEECGQPNINETFHQDTKGGNGRKSITEFCIELGGAGNVIDQQPSIGEFVEATYVFNEFVPTFRSGARYIKACGMGSSIIGNRGKMNGLGGSIDYDGTAGLQSCRGRNMVALNVVEHMTIGAGLLASQGDVVANNITG